MTIYEDLLDLRLHYLAGNLQQFVAQAESAAMKPIDIITRAVELEQLERSQRSIQRRLKEAKLGRFSMMKDFDWNWPKEVDRKVIESLFSCDYVEARQNIILAGPQGLGKTMIAKNLAQQAAMRCFSVLYTTASAMVIDLGAQENKSSLQRRLRYYESRDLLVLDEIGYLAFDNRAADFIFEVVNRRYEKGSIIITTNLAFKDWGQIFPGAPCVTAMIDRLTHHAKIIKITGDSYRLRESKSRKDKA
jgi:DNA replication protein DnaC